MTQRRPKGPVVDVRITQEIINSSTRKNSSHCMIAEAIKECYPGAKFVAVDISTCRFTDLLKGYRYTFLTPRKAQVELLKFDQGLKPDPFTFKLAKAHVTTAGRRKVDKPAATPGEQAPKKRRGAGRVLAPRDGKNGTTIPTPFGGKTPPRLPHTRREFGIRAFGQIAALAAEDVK